MNPVAALWKTDVPIVGALPRKHALLSLEHESKDRTMLFTEKEDFRITEETGELVRNWCKGTSASKEVEIDIQDSLSLVNNAADIKELISIWNDMSNILKSNEKIKSEFTKKKNELTVN